MPTRKIRDARCVEHLLEKGFALAERFQELVETADQLPNLVAANDAQ